MTRYGVREAAAVRTAGALVRLLLGSSVVFLVGCQPPLAIQPKELPGEWIGLNRDPYPFIYRLRLTRSGGQLYAGRSLYRIARWTACSNTASSEYCIRAIAEPSNCGRSETMIIRVRRWGLKLRFENWAPGFDVVMIRENRFMSELEAAQRAMDIPQKEELRHPDGASPRQDDRDGAAPRQ